VPTPDGHLLESEGHLEKWPLALLGSSADWLRQRLDAQGVILPAHSRLASALEQLRIARDAAGNSLGTMPRGAAFQLLADIFGAEFLSKSLHAGFEAGLQVPRARWRDMARGDPIVTAPAGSTPERNRTWEVVIASLVRTFSPAVSLAEPDLICALGGRQMAIAAKMAYSEKNLVQNIRQGFRQARNVADAALVFVNVVSIYPLRKAFESSISSPFGSPGALVQELTEQVRTWCDRLPLVQEATRLRERANRPIGVAFFVPFVVLIDGHPAPFWYTHIPLAWSGLEGPDADLATAFLGACRQVPGAGSNRQGQ
jgi:hypothetical protein